MAGARPTVRRDRWARRLAGLLAGLPLLLAIAAGARAQAVPGPAAAEASARPYATGDAWIDRQLDDIDAYARRYPASFLDEIARQLAVRRGYAEGVLQAPGWRAGDLYFACAWAQAVQLSCRELVRARSVAPQDDWQTVLARREPAPANLAYRQVRHAIVASYDRWDRPIALDARLREQLGNAEQRQERARQAAQAALQAADP